MTNNFFSGHLLRNFTADFLHTTLATFWDTPKEYKSIKNKMFEDNSFLTISKILDDKVGEVVDKQKLDEILFNELVWTIPDNHFIYFFDSPDSIDRIKDTINSKTHTLNMPIYRVPTDVDDLQLVSMREDNDSLILLFRNGFTKDEDAKKTIFFISCEFNFTRKTFIIKIRDTFRHNAGKNRRELLYNIIDYMKDLTPSVSYIRKNKKEIKNKIYNLFINETKKAEEIILSKLPINETSLDSKIHDFVLNNLNLTSLDDLDSNQKIIKYMYFQNVAQKLSSKHFYNRYIFAFSFHDGKTTRSVTRDSHRQHIYAKKLYWNLKSLVTDDTKVDEVSIYYKINKHNYKLPPLENNFAVLEVSIREFQGSYMIDFYNNIRQDSERRLKGEFILHELEEYL